jgi:hypothetical protein
MMTTTSWGPVQPAMSLATAREPRTIAEVVEALLDVQEALDRLPDLYRENPVSDFNLLYTDITQRILEQHSAGRFQRPEFLNVLDVEFGKRYLEALRHWGAGDTTTPASWRVLFGRYNDGRLRSLPCAAAGVNAHINYDLPFALTATWRRLGPAGDDSPQHHDYLLINQIFEDAIPGLRRDFLTAWQRRLDRLNGGFDDWYENLLVQVTRRHAWTRAQQLWRLRAYPQLVEAERASMDRQTAAIGQILLSRMCSLMQ